MDINVAQIKRKCFFHKGRRATYISFFGSVNQLHLPRCPKSNYVVVVKDGSVINLHIRIKV